MMTVNSIITVYLCIQYTHGPVLNLHSDVAVVGFERTYYEVPRSEGVVEVCATVISPDDVSCPIEFDFLLLISIDDGGKYGPLTVSILFIFLSLLKLQIFWNFFQMLLQGCVRNLLTYQRVYTLSP